MILIILWFWAQGPWGPWDPPCFDIFRKFVLWSGTYLEVFVWCLGVQGTPLLIYFIYYLIRNATFLKSFFIELPIAPSYSQNTDSHNF